MSSVDKGKLVLDTVSENINCYSLFGREFDAIKMLNMHIHVFAKIMYNKNVNYYIVTNSLKKGGNIQISFDRNFK